MKRIFQLLPIAALCIGYSGLQASPGSDAPTLVEPAAAFVFETSQRPRVADIDPSGGNQVAAFDLTSGTRIDIEVRADAEADLTLRGGGRPQVSIYPQQYWPAGHEILVVLSKHFPLSAGGDDYESRLAGASDPIQKAYFKRMNAALAQVKVQRSFVQSASLFTVPETHAQQPLFPHGSPATVENVQAQLAQLAIGFERQ